MNELTRVDLTIMVKKIASDIVSNSAISSDTIKARIKSEISELEAHRRDIIITPIIDSNKPNDE